MGAYIKELDFDILKTLAEVYPDGFSTIDLTEILHLQKDDYNQVAMRCFNIMTLTHFIAYCKEEPKWKATEKGVEKYYQIMIEKDLEML